MNIEFERPPPIDNRFRSNNHLLAKFTIDAFDEKGKYLGRVESSENDLLLNNFGRFLTGILPVAISSNSVRFSTMTSRTGVAITLATYSSTPQTSGGVNFGYLIAGVSLGAQVGTGTSTTAPARADTDLGGLLTLAYATGAGYTASNQVTVAGANVISNSATVNEAGVYFKVADASANVSTFLLAHDLVTPGIAVPSMGSASVNWALQI